VCRWWLLTLLVGCISPDLVLCDDGRACPVGTVCDTAHKGCVSPEQVSACTGMADLTPCMTSKIPNGACFGGVCLVAGCGNGQIEPGELCDDGNTVSGDGCSSDCKSLEICGDGYVDHNRGEECDDGNHRGRDGCSSVCTLERLLWTEVRSKVDVRFDAAVVFDTTRRKMVVFGGADPTNAKLSDTLEWNGEMWIEHSPLVVPPARSGGTLGYDPERHRVVMFGGNDGNSPLDDTWEWNGASWVEIATTIAPPPRHHAVMIWNPTLHAIVLIGGRTNTNGSFFDAWTWNGSVWTALPWTSPMGLTQDVGFFDPSRQSMVLIGDDNSALETWTFDGTAWSQLATSGPPPTTAWFGAAYDQNRERIVLSLKSGANGLQTWELVGNVWNEVVANDIPITSQASVVYDENLKSVVLLFGATAAGFSNDLYTWNGTDWSLLAPVPLPPARNSGAMASDPLRGRLVMFGGPDGDTWEWDGTSWSIVATSGPGQRTGNAMAYDGVSHTVILFGGATGTGPMQDTWTWDGQTWTPYMGSGPPPSASPAMAYDSARHQVVLHIGSPTPSTWVWDGSKWSDVTPSVVPPKRTQTALAYDANRQRVVLFGGCGGPAASCAAGDLVFDDTWEWDGSSWTAVPTTVQPDARYGHSLVYDRARQRVVVFGGFPPSSISLWDWDGSQWEHRSTNAGTRRRDDAQATYDDARREIVVFGGDYDVTVYRDHWSASFRGPDDEVCLANEDVDRDGLAGCADDDCDSVCRPTCFATCDPNGPRCGDGMCSTLENPLVCPSDCP
jgi:cysteine-rich repeat protein